MIREVNYATYTIDLDDNLRIININDGFTLLTGFTETDVYLGRMTLQDLIPPDEWDEYISLVKSPHPDGGFARYLEHRILKKDGSSIVVLCYGTPRGNTRLSDILITDVTSHIEAHNEVRRQEKEHRLWLKKLSIISENETEYIADYNATNDHFDITIIKDGQAQTIYSIDDYTKNLNSIQTIHPDDLEKYEKIFQSAESLTEKTTFDFRSTLFNNDSEPEGYNWYRAIYAPYMDSISGEWHIVGRIVNIDEEVARNQELQRQAEIDALTGLYNQGTSRRKIDEIAQAHPENAINAFIIMDLDNFKDINDTFGHSIGDEVLHHVGKTLKRFFRFGSDIIGRLGGDEFVIYVRDFSSTELVKKRSETLCRELNQSIYASGIEIKTSASIGVAVQANGPDSFDHLYKCADDALYVKKSNAKNGVYIYQD
nr:GGDEF domain-containing protein [Eubacterium sp.]